MKAEGAEKDRRAKIECPRCEVNSLTVIGSDVTEDNVGLKRYQCDECRHTYLSLETLFSDDQGDEDAFLQLALNHRLRNRENHTRRTGKKSRRQLKPIDRIRVSRRNGHVAFFYHRSKRVKAVFLICKRGHNLNETAYVNPTTGARTCKLCRRINQRDWNAKQAARREAQRRGAAA